MADLLPCPFCGSTNLRHEFAGSQGFIECNECGTAGPCDERAADPICDYDAAYAAWNRRAALAEPDRPAVPEGREPASVATQPSDEELEAFLVDVACQNGNMYYADLARWGQHTAPPAEEIGANSYQSLCRQLIKDLAAARDALEAWTEYFTENNQPTAKYFCMKEYESARDAHSKACNAMAILRRQIRWGRPAAAPMNNPYRAMCSELVEQVQRAINNHGLCLEASDALMHRARALLAEPDGPAVPDGREPASVAMQPTDEELDDWHSRCADLTRLGEAEHYWALDLQGDDVTAVARAALARWGHPAAAPVPEPGEVEGIAEWLNSRGRMADLGTRDWYFRAATLLQQQAAPVPVSERLPGPNTKVLAHYFNCLGKGRTICAIWVPAKSRSDDYGDDDFTEYDEEDDKFYWPEGWYEVIENWDELGWVKVDEGEIAYWQPLPKWPANALPLPAPEGGESQP